MAKVPLKFWSCIHLENTNDFEDLQKQVPNHDTPFSRVLPLYVENTKKDFNVTERSV